MFFLFVLITILVLLISLIFSKINIEIINFRFNSQTKRHINKDYQIIIKLKAFGIIPIFKFKITKTKLEKLKLQEKVKNINFKFLENNKIDKKILQSIKEIKISIKKFNLQADIGTENASLTSIIVPILSTILAILLQKNMKKIENQTFIIQPVYINQNLVNLFISGIFETKMMHIINMINNLNKKGVNKYERTSNRRAYDYSYE